MEYTQEQVDAMLAERDAAHQTELQQIEERHNEERQQQQARIEEQSKVIAQLIEKTPQPKPGNPSKMDEEIEKINNRRKN